MIFLSLNINDQIVTNELPLGITNHVDSTGGKKLSNV